MQRRSTPVPMAIVCEWMSDSIPSPNNNTTVQTVFVFAYYLSTPPTPPEPSRFYRPYLVISKLFVFAGNE